MTTITHPPPTAEPAVPPLLVDIHALAGLLDRSVASLERDQAAGRLPAPVRIGGSKKWRVADIRAWVADGCPARPTRRPQ
jgi:prophage regulatory protein